jgi:hypothetical protein
MFLGKRRDNAPSISKGKPRIRMVVSEDGTPRLDFLDEAGKVTSSLSGEAKQVKVMR